MADAAHWLAAARARYDDPVTGLAAAAARTRFDFAHGAAWMALALGPPARAAPVPASWRWLGVTKYSLALVPALACTALALLWLPIPLPIRLPVLLPLAIVVFYAVEVRMVFAFPLALHGCATPIRSSHALLAATAGGAWATWQVMRIAAVMLFGALGGGVRRSWCVGCLAVVAWYEHARSRAVAA